MLLHVYDIWVLQTSLRFGFRDLLSLVDMHCLVRNPLLKSLFKFKQYFQSLKSPLKKHYFFVQNVPYPLNMTVCRSVLTLHARKKLIILSS